MVTSVSNVDKKSAAGEVPVRLVNYTDVYHGDRITPAMDLMAATATSAQVRAFRVQPGDVLITKDSETADDIGIAAFVEASEDDMVLGYHLALLRPNADAVDGRFLYWALCSDDARGQLSSGATGVTRFGLRTDAIGSVELSAPEPTRQRTIARFLDTETAHLDALITKKRHVIARLDERYSALRSSVVLRGLDPVHGTVEGAFPDSWTVAPLGVLVMPHRGFDLPSDERQPGAVPVVSSGGISGRHSESMCAGAGCGDRAVRDCRRGLLY